MDDQRPKQSDLYQRIGKPTKPGAGDGYPYKGGGPAAEVRRISRAVMHLRFAALYCENGCDCYAAYRALFEPIKGHISQKRCKQQARKWLMSKRTQDGIKAILTQAARRAADSVTLSLEGLMQISSPVAGYDIGEAILETPEGGLEWRNPRAMSPELRAAIAKLVIDPETGRIMHIDFYDRLKGIMAHAELLVMAREAGANGGAELKKLLSSRIRNARQIKETIAQSAGKIVALEDRRGKTG
jgi:hypothetical protein